jgi:hypothetical protein
MTDNNWALTGNTGTDPNIHFLGTTDERSLVIRTNGKEVITIDIDGKVGIGRDPRGPRPTTVPEERLHVRLLPGEVVRIDGPGGHESIGGGQVSVNEVGTVVRLRADSEFAYLNSESELRSLQLQSCLHILLSPGTSGAGTSGVEGNVGIGTQRPETKVHVVGDRIRLQGSRKVLDLRVDGGGVDLHSETDDLFIRSNGPNGRNNVLINPLAQFGDGNVGIGTATPRAKLHVVGDLVVSGTKAFVQTNPGDPTKEIVYVALEGAEAGTYFRGTGELDNGKAVIELPEHFSLLTSKEGLTVQLTPRGEWLQLYVAQLNSKQIVVQETQGKSGQFDYLIQGVRKGYEHHQVIREKAVTGKE